MFFLKRQHDFGGGFLLLFSFDKLHLKEFRVFFPLLIYVEK